MRCRGSKLLPFPFERNIVPVCSREGRTIGIHDRLLCFEGFGGVELIRIEG